MFYIGSETSNKLSPPPTPSRVTKGLATPLNRVAPEPRGTKICGDPRTPLEKVQYDHIGQSPCLCRVEHIQFSQSCLYKPISTRWVLQSTLTLLLSLPRDVSPNTHLRHPQAGTTSEPKPTLLFQPDAHDVCQQTVVVANSATSTMILACIFLYMKRENLRFPADVVSVVKLIDVHWVELQ